MSDFSLNILQGLSTFGRRPHFVSAAASARDIVLAEQLESFTEQNGRSALRIVHMQRDGGIAARPRQQWISEMDIHFRHEQ